MRDRSVWALAWAACRLAGLAVVGVFGCAQTADTVLVAGGVVDGPTLAAQVHCPGSARLTFGRMRGVESSAWCETADGRKQGPFVDWYENHQKKTAGLYDDNRRQGVWSFWLPGGQLDSTITYDKGTVISQRSASPQPAAPATAAPTP
jgi:hypothetical protein